MFWGGGKAYWKGGLGSYVWDATEVDDPKPEPGLTRKQARENIHAPYFPLYMYTPMLTCTQPTLARE
jgi:hypothetical protein